MYKNIVFSIILSMQLNATNFIYNEDTFKNSLWTKDELYNFQLSHLNEESDKKMRNVKISRGAIKDFYKH